MEQEPKDLIKRENTLPEDSSKKDEFADLELWQPTKPMSVKEVLEEMKKAGRRALTLEEVEALMKKAGVETIEPKEDDIVINPEKVE